MKKPDKVFSLRRKAKQYFTQSLLLFSAVLLITVLGMVAAAKKTTQNYLESSLGQVGENIDGYLDQIEKSAFLVSSSTDFLSYYSNVSPSQNTNIVSSMFEIANSLSTYLPSFVDIAAVSTDGSMHSYHSGYSYSVFSELKNYGIFAADDNSRGFIFLSETPASSECFVYYFPIQDFAIQSSPVSEKTATAFYLFSKDTLKDYLNASQKHFATYQLRYDDQIVCRASDEASPASSRDQSSLALQNRNFTLTGTLQTYFFSTSTPFVYGVIFLFFLLFIVFYLLKVNRLVTNYINTPITALLTELSQFDSIGCQTLLEQTNVAEFNQIVQTTNQMIQALQESSREILHIQDHLYEVELREKETELYALQSQMNPHFLYNTLECIRGLATIGRMEEIKTIVQHLSAFYRYSTSPEPFVTLMDEIENVYKYLEIYQIRTDGSLSYHIDIDDDLLECDTVRMILQPIVENCIKHGFTSRLDGATIQILGACTDENHLLLRVIDNGCGMDYQQLTLLRQQLEYSFNESLMRGNKHLGLYNVNRRIKLLLGPEYGLSVFSNSNGTEVDISLPLVRSQV